MKGNRMVFCSFLHLNEKCEEQRVSPPSSVSVSTFPGGLATSHEAGWGAETDTAHGFAVGPPGWSAAIPLIKLQAGRAGAAPNDSWVLKSHTRQHRQGQHSL